MRARSSLLQILILVITLILVISPSLGAQTSIVISSRVVINYPEEPNHLPRLHVEGTYIKDDLGRTVYLKGVCFRTSDWWYSPEYPGLGRGTEDQFRYMSEWGCNVVRIEINVDARSIWGNDPAFRAKVDEMIGWAGKYGMYVVLDGYHMTGAYAPTWNLGTWSESDWDYWLWIWGQYAERYKDRTNVLYELMNEPWGTSYANYQARMRKCIDMIRGIDPDAICLVAATHPSSAGWWSFEFEQTYPINRPNIIYTDHHYTSVEYPQNPDKDAIRNYPIRARFWDWMLTNGRCVWIGEFNAPEDTHPEGLIWLRNFIEVLNEDGYAGWAGWNWGDQTRYRLCTDWNGNPSPSGVVLQDYLGGTR